MVNNLKGWIKCHSGTKIDIFKPKQDQILIEDISHALSRLCRFNGHVKNYYCVAQHSVFVSKIVDQKWALEALMHDCAEAFLGDICTPLKKHLLKYYEYEEVMERAIARKFGLSRCKECLKQVKLADQLALVTEARDLLQNEDSLCTYAPVDPLPITVKPWGIEKSKREFLKRFYELTTCWRSLSIINDSKIEIIQWTQIPLKMSFHRIIRTKKSATPSI